MSTLTVTQPLRRPPAASAVGIAARFADVEYVYAGGVRALAAASADIPAGRHTVIIGPSGAGKSTLLGCLSGRLSPRAGTLEVHGRVATIYQDLRLVPQRTALDNVLDGCLGRLPRWRTLGPAPAAERAAAVALLERLGLSDRIGAKVRALSGGERRRVAVARALMQRPTILLADEPVSSLDPASAESVMALLGEVCREHGVTLVSVLHDEALAERLADHRLVLRDGVLSPAGAPGSLIEPKPLETSPATATPASASPDNPAPAVLRREPVREPVRAVTLLVAGVIAVAIYAWAAVSLGLTSDAGRDAAGGLLAFLSNVLPTSWDQLARLPWASLLGSLVETVQMSLIGTTAGALLAYPAAVLAARNTGPRLLRPLVRQGLNAVRTVPSLIWALLFVAAVGLGPLAGVLALSLYSVGYLSKFFYESFEHAPAGPQQALREIGAPWPARFFRAVGPATRPAALASVVFMLEYNVRAASVLGVVDAGGIGYYLRFYLEIRNFPAALCCLLMIFVVVVALDAVSERLRRALVPE